MLKNLKSKVLVSMMIVSLLGSFAEPVQAKKTVPVKKIQVTAPKKSSIKMTVGSKFKLKVKVLPKKASNKKLKFITSNKKVASVNKKGVIKAVKKGTAKITVKAADKSKKKKVIKVNVVKKPVNNKQNNNVQTGVQTAAATPVQQTEQPQNTGMNDNILPEGDFTVASSSEKAQIYVNPDTDEYNGLKMVADCFAEDVDMVTDEKPEIVTDSSKLGGNVIIFGSIGNNRIIDNLISDGKINVDNVKGKWEVFQFDVVEKPVNGVDRALVITGSDKRGAIYGLFTLSEMIGVSPWVYWADVAPEHKDNVTFKYSELRRTSKEPSIKYRGIFLNDEEPALGTWVQKHFKKDSGSKFNEYFYEKVFQLLLRLKANYMWPAMWNSAFGAGGAEFPEKSAELADEYGIVMGTSHHEPMMLAHEEWNKYKSKYGNEWNWVNNEEGLTEFFKYGAEHYGQYDNLCTIGMRGDGDATMLPEGSSVEENVNLLKDIITAQKKILADKGLSDKPTMIALYKEVEEYWYGDSVTPGLKEWNGLDDTIVMLAEDNYGNLRTLPTEDVRERAGGWGMYYHFDYNGAPASYQWTQTFQLQKVWEQMSMAYDYGVDDIWIVNVGDLKPMEMPISYFLDMAYDFNKWGTSNTNSFSEYEKEWIDSQFGEYISDDDASGIAKLNDDYLKITTYRKPEIVTSSTYSIENYNEAYRILEQIDSIKQRADKYREKIPEELQAAYFQLIYYPAVATTNVIKIQIYSGLSKAYAKLKLTSANYYAALMNEAIEFDKELENIYNVEMPGDVGDKWDGMMDQAKNAAHIGYDTWKPEGSYPKAEKVAGTSDASMNVIVQGKLKTYTLGSVDMEEYTNINNESYYIKLMNSGNKQYNYSIASDSDWIVTDKTEGSVMEEDTVNVSVDFGKLSSSASGKLTITGNGQTVTVNINAVVRDVSSFDKNTYVEAHDYVAIEAGNYSDIASGKDNAVWKEIAGYGRTRSGMKVFPTTETFYDADEAPYMEYKFYVDNTEKYIMQTHIAPSNNVDWNNVTMKFAYSIDGGAVTNVDTITSSYIAGTWRDSTWSNAVRNNIRSIEKSLGTLDEGVHTLRIYAADPAVVMEKYIIYPDSVKLKSSYLGPQESYRKDN